MNMRVIVALIMSATRGVVIASQEIICTLEDIVEPPRLQVRGSDTGLYLEIESFEAILNTVALEWPRADLPVNVLCKFFHLREGRLISRDGQIGSTSFKKPVTLPFPIAYNMEPFCGLLAYSLTFVRADQVLIPSVFDPSF